MPKWSLSEMMSDLTYRLGRRVDIPRSIVSRYVNQAYADVANEARPSALERLAISSTTSGDNRYELPGDFAEPVSLSWLTNLGSSRTIRLTNHRRFDAKGFTPVGVPFEYALYGNWLELYPSPNSAYSLQLRYRSYVTDLVNATDVPSISTDWRFPIVLKAEMYLQQWLGNTEMASLAANHYAMHVATLDTDQGKRQRDKSGLKVRVIW
jgi:hypothetical protein